MNLEEEREALQRLGQTITRQNGKSQMAAEEIARQALAAQEYREAYERLMQMGAECYEAICDTVSELAKLLREAVDGMLCSMSFVWEELVREAEEGMAAPDGRDWQRDREREAIPREQARAAARYKAHRRTMTEHKARQHLRRRKYRSGANAGWY